MKITNISGISLPLAVWLMHDEYDYVSKPNYISATSLMKPLRHIIIPPRLPAEQTPADVQDFIASRLGSALHSSIEQAWTTNAANSLKRLGYPDSVIARILINPTEEEIAAVENPILVYVEQRAFREIVVNGETFTIGGKFDMVTDGIVNDTKSTSAYTWLYGGRDEEHSLQGSLYRWLDADLPNQGMRRRITEDYMKINYIFTDWQKAASLQNPKYPQKRVEDKDIPLMSEAETEKWVHNKLALIQKYRNTPEAQLPECTDEELWRSEPKFKYFSDPAKATEKGARSTKNFDDLVSARNFQAEKGKGVVITVPGEPKRCDYCAAFQGCTQKDRFFQ